MPQSNAMFAPRDPSRTELRAINDTELRLWEWGREDAAPVICVHGAFDHGRMWDGFAPAIADLGYRVVAIDQRGHGDSGRLHSGMSFEDSALDVAALAQQLCNQDGPGSHERVGLIGHSMGSSVAFTAAGTFPELVEWIISLDGLGPPKIAFAGPPIDELAHQGFAHAIRTFARPPRVFATKVAMAEQRGAINIRLPEPWLQHLVEHGSVAAEGGWSWKWDPAFNTNIPGGFREATILSEFERVQAPTLVLTGAADDMWSEMSSDEIASRISLLQDAEHAAVDDAGHYLHLEQPAEVFGAVSDFLADRRRQSS